MDRTTPRNCPLPWRDLVPHLTHCSQGSPESTPQSASLSKIGSAVFAGLTSVSNRQTDIHTDRPHYSIYSNRPHLTIAAIRSNNCLNPVSSSWWRITRSILVLISPAVYLRKGKTSLSRVIRIRPILFAFFCYQYMSVKVSHGYGRRIIQFALRLLILFRTVSLWWITSNIMTAVELVRVFVSHTDTHAHAHTHSAAFLICSELPGWLGVGAVGVVVRRRAGDDGIRYSAPGAMHFRPIRRDGNAICRRRSILSRDLAAGTVHCPRRPPDNDGRPLLLIGLVDRRP